MKKKTAPVKPTPVPDIPAVDTIAEALDAEPNQESALDKKNTMLYYGGCIFSGVIIFLTLWIFILAKSETKRSTVVVTAPVATPTATPTPAFVRSTITFEVLNGSGIAGKAAETASRLTALGYTVVSVGNADTPVATTKLYSSDTKHEVELVRDVGSLFSISSLSGSLSGTTVSARLVVGKK